MERSAIREEVLGAAALVGGGLVPVTMVNLATLNAMASKPADDMARMMILHEFMRLYLPWILLPSFLVLGAVTIYSRRHYPGLANRIIVGLVAGAVATIALDVFRLAGVRLAYMPADVPAMFGKMIVGPKGPQTTNLLAGYVYHFINGASFGLLYGAAVVGRGTCVDLRPTDSGTAATHASYVTDRM